MQAIIQFILQVITVDIMQVFMQVIMLEQLCKQKYAFPSEYNYAGHYKDNFLYIWVNVHYNKFS